MREQEFFFFFWGGGHLRVLPSTHPQIYCKDQNSDLGDPTVFHVSWRDELSGALSSYTPVLYHIRFLCSAPLQSQESLSSQRGHSWNTFIKTKTEQPDLDRDQPDIEQDSILRARNQHHWWWHPPWAADIIFSACTQIKTGLLVGGSQLPSWKLAFFASSLPSLSQWLVQNTALPPPHPFLIIVCSEVLFLCPAVLSHLMAWLRHLGSSSWESHH